MDDLTPMLRELDLVHAPDLRGEARRRIESGSLAAPEPPIRPKRPAERLVAAAVGLVVFAAAAAFALRALGDAQSERPRPADTWSWAGEGWTELPAPPEWRDGAAIVWTDKQLLVWGGCSEDVEDDCEPTRGGYAFDPSTGSWSALPDAPIAAGLDAIPVWTGHEVLFLGVGVRGVAFDPPTRSWRELAPAPFVPHVATWTGNEVVAIHPADERENEAVAAATYDPTTDRWDDLPTPPVVFTGAIARWTGSDLVLLASHLDPGRRALTPTVQALSLDLGTRTWRLRSPSALYPQSYWAEWTGAEILAWDHGLQAQSLDPAADVWTAPQRVPIEEQECYTRGARTGSLVFLWYCGDAAIGDGDSWEVIHGGPLEETVYSRAYERELDVWRFADLIGAGDVVVAFMEGITLDDEGVACYGCGGSPLSFWVYRPPAQLEPTTAVDAPDRAEALDVASEFMDARTIGAEGRIVHLATQDAVDMFEHVVPEPLFTGSNFSYDRGSVEPQPESRSFEVTVTLQIDGEVVTEILTVGPGLSVEGEERSLIVTAIRLAS